MNDPVVIISIILLVFAIISFIVVLKILSWIRGERMHTPIREYGNSGNGHILEELKARQDQDKAAFLEFLSDKLGEISQKIGEHGEVISKLKKPPTGPENARVDEEIVNQMNKRIEEIETTINNLLHTIKDDRAILIGWIREEMKAFVNTTKQLNESLQSLQIMLRSRNE